MVKISGPQTRAEPCKNSLVKATNGSANMIKLPRGFKTWCKNNGWKIKDGDVHQLFDNSWKNVANSIKISDLIRMFWYSKNDNSVWVKNKK
jgi:hypothetical protein